MHNTVKHARANNIHVRLCRLDETIRLEIEDDGQGFDPSGDFPGHLGLRNMRERARSLGGALAIASEPGQGTKIRMEVPA